MKPRDALKLNIAELDKSETYPAEEALPEDGLCRYLYQPDEQDEDQKDQLLTSSGVKIDIGYMELQKSQVTASCTICKTGLMEPLYVRIDAYS